MLRIAPLLEPLKSGGSLPWLGVADDGRRYVVEFAGAGHGRAALLAELVVGRLARRWSLRVPAVTPIWLDQAFSARHRRALGPARRLRDVPGEWFREGGSTREAPLGRVHERVRAFRIWVR